MKHASDVRASNPTQVTILGSETDVKFDTGDEEESARSLRLCFRRELPFSAGSYKPDISYEDREVQERSRHQKDVWK